MAAWSPFLLAAIGQYTRIRGVVAQDGARGGGRTRTRFRETDFKSVASTNSATRASVFRAGKTESEV